MFGGGILTIWIVAAMAVAVSTSATKAEEVNCPIGGDPKVAATRPDWLRPPTGDEMQWAYPPKAAAQNIAGRAIISCQVQLDGTLADCVVKDETPKAMGFGEAALSLAPVMRFKPATRCGAPVVAPVTVPLVFSVPQDPKPAEGPPPPPEAVALARRLLTAMGMEDDYGHVVVNGLEAQVYDATDEATTLTADQRRAVHDAATDAWAGLREETFNAISVSVARQLDPADLKAILAFYESPVGQRMVQRQPLINTAILGELSVIAPKIQDQFDAIYCRKVGNCDVKKALDALH